MLHAAENTNIRAAGPLRRQPSRISRLARQGCSLMAVVLLLQGCSDASYVQRASPSNMYKDYRADNQGNTAVIGVGEPMSTRQMKADSTITLQGSYDIEQVMQRVGGTYNLAVRWGNGVRKAKRNQILVNQLTFDEARNYIEDVYDVQIIREGERRLLVLPSASEPRLANFSPGDDVTLATAVKGLAQQCGYNMVINENKQELGNIRVSTKLKDVTCFDAFEALLTPHGLSLSSSGDYYTISGLPQRQWTVALYEPIRSEEQSVTLSTESGSSGGSGVGGGSGGSGGGTESSQTVSGSNSVTIKYERNLWKDLEGDLNQLISSSCAAPQQQPANTAGNLNVAPVQQATLLPPPTLAGQSGDANLISPTGFTPLPVNQAVGMVAGVGNEAAEQNRCGYVRINASVGLIQMRAPNSVLEEANNLIQRVQDIASRRLMLEARVLAVARTRGYDQKGRLNIGNIDNTKNTGNELGFGGSITSALSSKLNVFNQTIGSQTTPTGGVAFGNENLDVALSFLEQYGTTYTLMRPMMELMDRQRATLIDGTNRKYYIITSESTTGTATTTSNSVEEKSQFIGLQFSASAQIGEDGEPHTISLQVPITELNSEINVPDGNGGSSGTAPIVNTRLIDQKVRVRDGEIKVIGGLTRTMAIDRESGVPILRDVSGLGKLANQENINYENIEFVVLLQVRRMT